MTGNSGGGGASTHKVNSIYKSELYILLKEKLPGRFICDDGRLNTAKLAAEMGMARYSIYRWFNGDNMRAKSAAKLAALKSKSEHEREGDLSVEMLTKFVLGF